MSITLTLILGCGELGTIPIHGATIAHTRPTITARGGVHRGITHGAMTLIGARRGIPVIIPVTILTTIPITHIRVMHPLHLTVMPARAHIVQLAPIATMATIAEDVPIQAVAMVNITVNAQVHVATGPTTVLVHHHAATTATHR